MHQHGPPNRYSFRWAALWQWRGLFRHFGKPYVTRRYRRTWLGWLWIPLRPAYDVVGRSILFGGLLSVSSGTRPYFMFFIVGSTAWRFVSLGILQSARALDVNRALFARTNLPRASAVAAAIVPGVIDALMYGVIGLAGACYYKLTRGSFFIAITPTGLSAAAAGFALLALYVFAIGLWIAPWAFHARDIRYLMTYVIGLWYMVTPIIYPISSIPKSYRGLAEYNPLTAPCELVKYGFLQTNGPPATSLLVSLGVLGLLLLGGAFTFARAEAKAAAAV